MVRPTNLNPSAAELAIWSQGARTITQTQCVAGFAPPLASHRPDVPANLQGRLQTPATQMYLPVHPKQAEFLDATNQN
jgi:hypothetical protein